MKVIIEIEKDEELEIVKKPLKEKASPLLKRKRREGSY